MAGATAAPSSSAGSNFVPSGTFAAYKIGADPLIPNPTLPIKDGSDACLFKPKCLEGLDSYANVADRLAVNPRKSSLEDVGRYVRLADGLFDSSIACRVQQSFNY